MHGNETICAAKIHLFFILLQKNIVLPFRKGRYDCITYGDYRFTNLLIATLPSAVVTQATYTPAGSAEASTST